MSHIKQVTFFIKQCHTRLRNPAHSLKKSIFSACTHLASSDYKKSLLTAIHNTLPTVGIREGIPNAAYMSYSCIFARTLKQNKCEDAHILTAYRLPLSITAESVTGVAFTNASELFFLPLYPVCLEKKNQSFAHLHTHTHTHMLAHAHAQ